MSIGSIDELGISKSNVRIFTARAYAERGIATASRLSVRPSARLSVFP